MRSFWASDLRRDVDSLEQEVPVVVPEAVLEVLVVPEALKLQAEVEVVEEEEEEEPPPLPRIWFSGLVRRSVSRLEPILTRALRLPLSLRHSVFHPQNLSLLQLSLYTKAFFVFYHLLRFSILSFPFFFISHC